MRRATIAAIMVTSILAPLSVTHAGSIYLCRAYSGGTFWAQTHCNQHNALIERIVSVPDNMSFDQQVALGEQQRSSAANASRQSTTVNTTTFTQQTVQPDRASECKALASSIEQYDAMAMQPQSGYMQDWMAAQRKKARDRQFQIEC